MRCALALVLILTAPALAWNEPATVGGVPWGATQAELKAQLAPAGDALRCDGPEICTTARATLGPVPVSIKYLFPNDGKFEMAIVTFKSTDYKPLRTYLYEQYGTPASSRSERYVTRGTCAEAINEIAEWSGERVLIELRRHGAQLEEGRAMIMLKALRDREAASDGAPASSDAPKDRS